MRRLANPLALATMLAVTPGMPQAAPAPVVLVQAGHVLDRPGKPARGPSTIVVRDGRVVTADGPQNARAFGEVVRDALAGR